MTIAATGAPRRLTSRTATSFAIRLASAGLSYVLIVALARRMSPAEYGWYAIGISLATAIGISMGLGQPTAILRFWPGHIAKGEPELALGALRTGARVSLAASIASAALFAVVVMLLPAFGSHANVPALLVAAVLIPICAQEEFWSSALRSLGSVVWALLPRDVLWRAATIAVALLYGASGVSLTGFQALGWSAAILLSFVVLQRFVAWQRVPAEIRALEPKTDIAAWRKTWLGMWGATAILVILAQMDPVIVGAMMRSTQAGHFFAAARTAQLLTLTLVAANLVVAPQISASYHRGDVSGIQFLCRSIARITLFATSSGFLVLVLFSHSIMRIFGPGFAEMDTGLRILAIGTAVNSLSGPVGMLMMMTGRERPYLIFVACTTIVTVIVEIVGIHFLGITGAAIANATTQTLWNVGVCVYIRRTMGIDTSVLSLFTARGRAEPQAVVVTSSAEPGA